MRAAPPTFVCPVALESRRQVRHFQECIESVLLQDEDDWVAVFVEDGGSPYSLSQVERATRRLGRRAIVLCTGGGMGPGAARNIGIVWAERNRAPFVMFQDADDIADHKRVANSRRLFSDGADFIYSAFDLIDEEGRVVDASDASPSIVEILDALRTPPIGATAWLDVALDVGYATLTSTVSVRTELARSQLFPGTFASEDQHAWLRLMASTDNVVFDAASTASYRIATDGSGSSARRRVGNGFYEQAAWVDMDGFTEACEIALSRGTIREVQLPALVHQFFERTAQSLDAEFLFDLGSMYRRQAQSARLAYGRDALLARPPMPVLHGVLSSSIEVRIS